MNTSVNVNQQLPVWCTVRLGTGPKTGSELREALMVIGVQCTAGSYSVVLKDQSFKSTEVETEVDLVCVSRENFRPDTTLYRHGLDELAFEAGLTLCPAEVGPRIWLQHPNLLELRQKVEIRMKLIADQVLYLDRPNVHRPLEDWTWSDPGCHQRMLLADYQGCGHKSVYIQPRR